MQEKLKQLEEQGFAITEHVVGGDPCVLVVGSPLSQWTKDNLIYRSSMWRKEDWFPVSLGYKKFFNWSEKPDLSPAPVSLNGCHALEKIDGSCLLVTRYKNEWIIRTRGSPHTEKCANHHEIALFKEKYPNIFADDIETWGYTQVYEWVSPLHRIVLPYAEPELYLTNVIIHDTYEYWQQKVLDRYNEQWLYAKRPRWYEFSDIAGLLTAVPEFVGVEGVCLYYNDDQDIRKVKGKDYLLKHYFKSNLSLEALVELVFERNLKNFEEIEKFINETYDYECWKEALPFASRICDGLRGVTRIIEGMQGFVEKLKLLPTRKEQAQQIISSYGETNRASFVFSLLDGRELTAEQKKKLLYQAMKA